MARAQLQRILVVEDSLLVALDIQEILQEAGYTVVGLARDLGEAQSLLDAEQLDCALLDITLGTTSVFPFARQLKERDIPFIFLSGHGDDYAIPPDLTPCLRLVKPFKPHSLLQELARLMAVAA